MILDYEGKSKFINSADTAEMEQMDQMAMMMGPGQNLEATSVTEVNLAFTRAGLAPLPPWRAPTTACAAR